MRCKVCVLRFSWTGADRAPQPLLERDAQALEECPSRDRKLLLVPLAAAQPCAPFLSVRAIAQTIRPQCGQVGASGHKRLRAAHGFWSRPERRRWVIAMGGKFRADHTSLRSRTFYSRSLVIRRVADEAYYAVSILSLVGYPLSA